MDKYRATRLALQQDSSLTALATFTPSPLATVRDLTRVHTPDYVTRFIRGQCSAKEMRNIGFPWTGTSSSIAAQCTRCALDWVLHLVLRRSYKFHVDWRFSLNLSNSLLQLRSCTADQIVSSLM